MSNKIFDLEELKDIVKNLKSKGKKIVLCHGVFDLLHPGHFKHFIAAKKFGDVLIVTLTEDKFVNKGPDRPVFNEVIRGETIASVGVVDYVAINRSPTAITAIQAIQPDFYVKGQDYEKMSEDITGGIFKEKKEVEKFGGKLVFTHEEQFSSSKLINRHIDNKNDELKKYLDNFRKKYSYNDILKYFNKIEKLKVTIIGDIILDEYQFVHPLDKSSKSPNITAKILNTELYAGGVLAVANHVADFVKSVNLVSCYGLNNNVDYYDFIKENVHESVSLNLIFTPDRPTTLKRRFVDGVFKTKLFEVIEIDDKLLPKSEINKLKGLLQKNIIDILLVSDFGHGLIDKRFAKYISKLDSFISVNTQTNSANKGFNVITKYPKCNYFSIDKLEAQLAVHDKESDIDKILKKLALKTKTDKATITLGVNGCLVYDNSDFAYAPVLSNEIVDTIGAGDAFLSITTLLAKVNAPSEIIAFVGNAVGSLAVKIIGNKSYIEKVSLLKYIKTLLA